MAHEPELSALAVQCRDARLPGLLAALRTRRRRQLVRRALVAALVVAAPAIAVWRWPATAAPTPQLAPQHVAAAAPTWQVVGDDATVLARCEVRDTSRREWWLDDADLRAELRGAARPDGLVRIGDQVLVSAAAIDRFPVAAESP